MDWSRQVWPCVDRLMMKGISRSMTRTQRLSIVSWASYSSQSILRSSPNLSPRFERRTMHSCSWIAMLIRAGSKTEMSPASISQMSWMSASITALEISILISSSRAIVRRPIARCQLCSAEFSWRERSLTYAFRGTSLSFSSSIKKLAMEEIWSLMMPNAQVDRPQPGGATERGGGSFDQHGRIG